MRVSTTRGDSDPRSAALRARCKVGRHVCTVLAELAESDDAMFSLRRPKWLTAKMVYAQDLATFRQESARPSEPIGWRSWSQADPRSTPLRPAQR